MGRQGRGTGTGSVVGALHDLADVIREGKNIRAGFHALDDVARTVGRQEFPKGYTIAVQKTPDLSADANFKMTAPEQGVSTPAPDPTGPHPEKQTDANPDPPLPIEDKEERERKRRRRRAIIAAAARNGRGL
ncbi:MAG: hypothetical protein ACOYJQ_17950 [Pseudochelatococcus sp.]|uniref:hypothetical protein n=1 Tax=Pseudochelatococcus sp. TaxID=2020869 RepID=UPI003D908D79